MMVQLNLLSKVTPDNNPRRYIFNWPLEGALVLVLEAKNE